MGSCFSQARNNHLDILDGVIRALEACRTVVEHLPIPAFPAIVNGVLALAYKVRATKANQEAIEDLASELRALSEVLRTAIQRVHDRLRQLPSADEARRPVRLSPHFQLRIDSLQRELDGLNGRADRLSQGSFLSRCWRRSRDLEIILQLQEGVEKALRNFRLESEIFVEALVDEIASGVSHVEEQVSGIREQMEIVQTAIERVDSNYQADRNERVLEDLPHVEAAFTAASQVTKSQYLEGTFTDVLEELSAWAQGHCTVERWRKPVWSMTGPAGSGKSTVAYRLAQQLHGQNLGATFFFDHADEDLSSTRSLFSTIAYQLARSQPALYPHIVEAARAHRRSGKNQQMEYDAKNLVLHPLQKLPPQELPIVVIVDGLDECAEREVDTLPQMLDLLIACARLPSPPLRILLTFRPHDTVNGVLDAPELAGVIHRVSLDTPRKAADDIAIVLRHRTSRIPYLQRHPNAIRALVSRAGMSFAYAQVMADFLLATPKHVEERIALVGLLEPAQHASFYMLYSAVAGKTPRPNMDSGQWERLRRRAGRPAVLDLCGTAACYACITEWLRCPGEDIQASGVVPLSLLDRLCTRCRAVVQGKPLELWTLKRIIESLLARGLDAASVLPSIPQAGSPLRADPWIPVIRTTSRSYSPKASQKPRIDRADNAPRVNLGPSDNGSGPADFGTLLDQAPKLESMQPPCIVPPIAHVGQDPASPAIGISMPVASTSQPFVGGFAAQIQTAMAAAVPEVSPFQAPTAPPPAPISSRDSPPILTPVAPTSYKPQLPKLDIPPSAFARHQPQTTPVPLSALYPFRRRTPVDLRSRTPTVLRTAARLPATRASPRSRRSPAACRNPTPQKLEPSARRMVVDPWTDVRRALTRAAVAASPLRPRLVHGDIQSKRTSGGQPSPMQCRAVATWPMSTSTRRQNKTL